MSIPDYALGATIEMKFTSRDATGLPTALSSGNIDIYEDAGTTQITGADTLTASFDSVTGLNHLTIAATAANGFENGKSYQCVLSAGTVGGVSVVGEVVFQFTIGRYNNAETQQQAVFSRGGTDQTCYLRLRDVRTGGPLTGVAFNASGLTCYYIRSGAAAVQLTLATQTDNGAHSDGGFVEVSSANVPGEYRLDISDAIAASGVDRGEILVFGAANMAPARIQFELVDAVTVANGGVLVNAFTSGAKAEINAEVVDVLATDTYAEPGQGAPAATASLAAKINYLYKAWRNKKTQTATAYNLFADDATTVDQKATLSDDGTTWTGGEIASGP